MHEFTLLGIFNYIIVFMFYCKTTFCYWGGIRVRLGTGMLLWTGLIVEFI